MSEAPLNAARESGLIRPGEPLLVLVSGGGDSVALLDVAVRLKARVSALHVNYGLREGADADETLVRELCERLGVPLRAERVPSATTPATSRSRPATPATRWPSGWPPPTMPPPTPPPTRPRRCSIAWPCRPARGRCTACPRGGGGWSGRSSP